MKREARLLLTKAVDALVLSIEHFNRPSDRGRVTSVLIILDHGFEMLLKAAITHKGGKIYEAGKRETIGFDACIRKGLSDGSIQFLTSEQAITLQTINGLRDAAQHYLVDVSEQQLYLHAQSGVTLFRDLLRSVFGQSVINRVPTRVLPVSTIAPTDLQTLFEDEVNEVRKLLAPGRRRKAEALARLRPLAILDATIRGEKLQPSDADLTRFTRDIIAQKPREGVFAGVASIQLISEGQGPMINLRFAKKEGIPMQVVPEGTPGASVVAVKRVDELGFYNLGRDQLAEKVGLSGPKTTALVWHMKVCDDADCFQEITIGKATFKRYSQKAIERLKSGLTVLDMNQVWDAYQHRSTPKE